MAPLESLEARSTYVSIACLVQAHHLRHNFFDLFPKWSVPPIPDFECPHRVIVACCGRKTSLNICYVRACRSVPTTLPDEIAKKLPKLVWILPDVLQDAISTCKHRWSPLHAQGSCHRAFEKVDKRKVDAYVLLTAIKRSISETFCWIARQTYIPFWEMTVQMPT